MAPIDSPIWCTLSLAESGAVMVGVVELTKIVYNKFK